MANTIGAVLIVQDEEADIAGCLRSLGFCDEVIVVDGGSRDRTREIATSFANVRLFARLFDSFTTQRAFAVDASTTSWFLQIDADERVTDLAREEMVALVRCATPVDALRFRFNYYAFGRQVRHGGYGSYSEVRFIRRAAYLGMSDRTVHEYPVLREDAIVRQAEGRLTHLTYATRAECREKSDRYAAGEAEELRRYLRSDGRLYWLPFSMRDGAAALRNRGGGRTLRERLRPLKNKRPSHATRVFGPPAKFALVYIAQGGFLDGAAGLYLAYMHARYIRRKYRNALVS